MDRSAAEQALSANGEQLRYRGPTREAYMDPLARLRKWAPSPYEDAMLTALTHHGWARGGAAPCRQSASPTCKNAMALAATGVLPADAFTLWEPTGPQIVSCFMRLRAAHAPMGDLEELWACYSGAGAEPTDLPDADGAVSTESAALDEQNGGRGIATVAAASAGEPNETNEPDADENSIIGDPARVANVRQVQLVPPEVCNVLEYERNPAGGETARRTESDLVKRFEAWLSGQGRNVQRAQISVTEELRPLVTDTYDVTRGVLYEAKSSADRATIRLGVGQLLDYLRHLPGVQGALLLPSDPSYDLREFIFSCGFWVTYQEDDAWVTETTNRDEPR